MQKRLNNKAHNTHACHDSDILNKNETIAFKSVSKNIPNALLLNRHLKFSLKTYFHYLFVRNSCNIYNKV